MGAIHSGKHRKSYSFVGIEFDQKKDKIFVKMAKRWIGREFTKSINDITSMFLRFKLIEIVVDQNNMGEHNIQKLKQKHNIPISVINTQKNLKDPQDVRTAKTMDKIEMVDWFVNAKEEHKIIFQKNTKDTQMLELEKQVSIFAEKMTESGTVDYYAPGEEYDDMVLALILACFKGRTWLGWDMKKIYEDYPTEEIHNDFEEMSQGTFSIPFEDDY